MKININKYKAFFFDFDGVIVDSLDIKTKAFGDLFKEYGRSISNEVIEYHRNNGGVSRYEKFKYYYKNLLNKEINQRIINKLDRDYSKLVVKEVIEAPYVKGIIALLKRLYKRKKSCFIISGTPQKEIRNILRRRKISVLFKGIAGSPENKAKNLEILLKKHHISPAEAIFFGDAKSDYEAARNNHTDFIAIVNSRSRELAKIRKIPKIRNFLGVFSPD